MLRFPSALCPFLLSQLDCVFPSREPFRTRSALAQTDKDTALIACRCSRAGEKTRWGEGLGICQRGIRFRCHRMFWGPVSVGKTCNPIFPGLLSNFLYVTPPVVSHCWLQPGIWNLEMLSSSSGGQVSCSRIDGRT